MNSFSSVSLEPPLVLWSIKRTSKSLEAFEAASHFAVNVLSRDQVELSQKFAKSGENKFNDVEWHRGDHHLPLLNGVVATFECQLVRSIDGGDHIIFLGEVGRFRRFEREPLLFSQGQYATACEHPSILAAQHASNSPKTENTRLMSHMMRRGYIALASVGDRARAAVDLSLSEARMLQAAETLPNRKLDIMSAELLMGSNESEQLLQELVQRELLNISASGEITATSEGRRRLISLLEQAKNHEQKELAGFSEAEIDTTRALLSRVIERYDKSHNW